jgi:hypothetical protein
MVSVIFDLYLHKVPSLQIPSQKFIALFFPDITVIISLIEKKTKKKKKISFMIKIELFSTKTNDINNKTKKLKTKRKNGSQFALSINGTRSCYQQAALVAPILLH